MTTLSGCWLLSSRLISQGIGSIWLQSPPAGQHNAVVLAARAMHDSPMGQQNSSGKSPEHWVYDESPHVEARPKSSDGDTCRPNKAEVVGIAVRKSSKTDALGKREMLVRFFIGML